MSTKLVIVSSNPLINRFKNHRFGFGCLSYTIRFAFCLLLLPVMSANSIQKIIHMFCDFHSAASFRFRRVLFYSSYVIAPFSAKLGPTINKFKNILWTAVLCCANLLEVNNAFNITNFLFWHIPGHCSIKILSFINSAPFWTFFILQT